MATTDEESHGQRSAIAVLPRQCCCWTLGVAENEQGNGVGKVLETLLVVAVGLIPSLLSVWVMRKAQVRTRTKLRAAMNVPVTRQQLSTTPPPLERHYLEGVGYLIGDISCRFNARCDALRCAVNPQGPCQGCRDYETREADHS